LSWLPPTCFLTR
jgi:U6 snRNA-associated Sm-like protein LSm7